MSSPLWSVPVVKISPTSVYESWQYRPKRLAAFWLCLHLELLMYILSSCTLTVMIIVCYLGRVANPKLVATIKTGRVAQPITDAFWCDWSWICNAPPVMLVHLSCVARTLCVLCCCVLDVSETASSQSHAVSFSHSSAQAADSAPNYSLYTSNNGQRSQRTSLSFTSVSCNIWLILNCLLVCTYVVFSMRCVR